MRLLEKLRKRGCLAIGTGAPSADWVSRAVGDARRWSLKTDHWFYGLFQSAPDLITMLLHRRAPLAPVLHLDSP
jgi:hypothetical protein